MIIYVLIKQFIDEDSGGVRKHIIFASTDYGKVSNKINKLVKIEPNIRFCRPELWVYTFDGDTGERLGCNRVFCKR